MFFTFESSPTKLLTILSIVFGVIFYKSLSIADIIDCSISTVAATFLATMDS